MPPKAAKIFGLLYITFWAISKFLGKVLVYMNKVIEIWSWGGGLWIETCARGRDLVRSTFYSGNPKYIPILVLKKNLSTIPTFWSVFLGLWSEKKCQIGRFCLIFPVVNYKGKSTFFLPTLKNHFKMLESSSIFFWVTGQLYTLDSLNKKLIGPNWCYRQGYEFNTPPPLRTIFQ